MEEVVGPSELHMNVYDVSSGEGGTLRSENVYDGEVRGESAPSKNW